MRCLATGFVIAGALAATVSVAYAAGYPADNTATNERDRNPDAVTADQQSNDKGDVGITQRIREAVMADKALSTNAHDVKIITDHGHVPLRGPVNTAEEKTAINAIATRVVGPTHVGHRLRPMGFWRGTPLFEHDDRLARSAYRVTGCVCIATVI